MATSNRVFVSPGVYTSEKDLTFVAQSVGVTTLGLVGETLKGPAFEPLLITSFDEFKTYFGNTSPEKDGSSLKNPKYELPYVAKAYLQESNQLFVTRILGLTGYLPVKTFGLKTIGGINLGSTTNPSLGSTTYVPSGSTSSTYYAELTGKTATTGDSVPEFIAADTYSHNEWFTIGLVPSGSTSILTGSEIVSPIGDFTNYQWYNNFFNGTNTVYAYLFIYNSGTTLFNVTRFGYSGATVNNYSDITVAALRSRGRYVGSTLTLEVTGDTGFTIDSTTIEQNPLGEFTMNIAGATGGNKSFTCSMDKTSTKYITKVLGSDVFDKAYSDYPLYVYEAYPIFLKALNDRGLVRGLSLSEVYHTVGDDFLHEWDTAMSPMVVSEVRGGKVDDLFEVVTISDGDSSNSQIKITILNINLETSEFDLLVRDFNDTDENMVILEKYSRCSMNPELPGYVALKIGTSDTKYELRSKYIMLVMNEAHPTDAVPSGFKGFKADTLSSTILGNVMYKTEFYDAGDVVTYTSGVPDNTPEDRIRKVSLGLSSQVGFDSHLFKYKGHNADTTSTGFHLSVNAAGLTGDTITGFAFDCTPYDFEGTDKGKLDTVSYRKFTFTVCGGFDGWDVYRSYRTFEDAYIYKKSTYDACNTDNGGVFNVDLGNSDYYAYLAGITTFGNPEAIDINVFATPGINFKDHSSLTTQAIDMIETDRADSLYIIATPNYDTADEVINEMDTVGLDSNYSAVYWPWI